MMEIILSIAQQTYSVSQLKILGWDLNEFLHKVFRLYISIRLNKLALQILCQACVALKAVNGECLQHLTIDKISHLYCHTGVVWLVQGKQEVAGVVGFNEWQDTT